MVDVQSNDCQPATGAVETRLATILLIVAVGLVVAAGLNGISDPWEADPVRGFLTSQYTAEWVDTHVRRGLSTTMGIPSHEIPGNPPLIAYNWHHPALYPILLAGPGSVFGTSPLVLRATHLLLFIPGLIALYALVRRHSRPLTGSIAALLLASCPFVTYFGLMVIQDGASLSAMLVTSYLFQAHLDHRIRWWLPALGMLTCGLMDIPCYFTGFALLALALNHTDRRSSLRATFIMLLAAILALLITSFHYGIVLGGPFGYLSNMLDLADREAAMIQSASNADLFARQMRIVLTDYGAAPLASLSLLGALVTLFRRRPGRPGAAMAGLALMLPGIASYTLFLGHAVRHTFWSLLAFGGIAALAAVAFVQIATAFPRHRKLRIATRTLAALMLVAIATFGCIRTHSLIGVGAERVVPALDLLSSAAQLTEGCNFILASSEFGFGRFGGEALVMGSVRDKFTLDNLLEISKVNGLRGEVGFILTPQFFHTPLHGRLVDLAEPQPAGDIIVFRFPID